MESNASKADGRRGRKLITWTHDKNEQLLICLVYSLQKHGIPIPWETVAETFSRDGTTISALEQHLTKLRKQRMAAGKSVPPLAKRARKNFPINSQPSRVTKPAARRRQAPRSPRYGVVSYKPSELDDESYSDSGPSSSQIKNRRRSKNVKNQRNYKRDACITDIEDEENDDEGEESSDGSYEEADVFVTKPDKPATKTATHMPHSGLRNMPNSSVAFNPVGYNLSNGCQTLDKHPSFGTPQQQRAASVYFQTHCGQPVTMFGAPGYSNLNYSTAFGSFYLPQQNAEHLEAASGNSLTAYPAVNTFSPFEDPDYGIFNTSLNYNNYNALSWEGDHGPHATVEELPDDTDVTKFIESGSAETESLPMLTAGFDFANDTSIEDFDMSAYGY